MSPDSTELPYRILSVEQLRRNRLRFDIALIRPASAEELTRMAENLWGDFLTPRATVFYSLLEDPKPVVAWAVSSLEKGKLPRTDIIGVTPGELLQIKAVRLPGKIIGDWISESNAIPRLVLLEAEGKTLMRRVHKSLYTDCQELHREGLSLYRPSEASDPECCYYQIEDGGRLLLLLDEAGHIVTAYRSR